MARATEIHSHEVFKLGKADAKRDDRNLLFATLLRAPAKLPDEYDFDLRHTGIPMPMFANDKYGCCVIAGRAHQTLRFELLEAKSKLAITDKQVLAEYLKESGGKDSGLVVLDSLKAWRSHGWKAAGSTYKIQAFSEVAPKQHNLVKQAVYMDVGVGLGLSLPVSAQAQMQSGKPWDVVGGKNGARGSWGGHYVFVPGYTKKGPVCVTWGAKRQMTWAFFDKYCDEAYAIIDAVDTAKKKAALDTAKLKAFLAGLKKKKK
ncbi:MAG: hypothetical protein JF616_11985 [Fibrobacteres bacterium]|nr:hypothetical protein [Fibrobacterota bacterium]